MTRPMAFTRSTVVSDWCRTTQRRYFLDALDWGDLRVLEHAHPAFDSRMPPLAFHLHVRFMFASEVAAVMGGDRPIRSNRVAGVMLVALPHEAARFTQDREAHRLVVELPCDRVLSLAGELPSDFPATSAGCTPISAATTPSAISRCASGAPPATTAQTRTSASTKR